MTSSNDEIFYRNQTINLGIPINSLKENFSHILSPENFDKFINNKDLERLYKFLPSNKDCFNRDNIKNILFENKHKDTSIYKSPLDKFQTMLNRNYFSKNYQNNLKRLELDGIENYLDMCENTLEHLEKNSDKYYSLLNSKENISIDGATNIMGREYLMNFESNEVIFETNSYLASSGYTTLNSDDEKENDENENFRDNTIEMDYMKPLESESNMEGSLSDERFRNLKMNKNQLTIKTRTNEEIKEYQLKELERYKFPHLPWGYTNPDGTVSVVSPVQKKIPTGTASKPRDHVMLKPDRPAYVTILCLVRDAASRLPEGVGTRADICDLLKDSQYINERLSDAGALDRLHYEKDPCVKYDLQKKLWIYLHKNRTIDYPPWNEHLISKEQEKQDSKIELSLNPEDKLEENDGSVPIINTINSSGKKIKKDKLLKNKRKHSK